MFAEASEKVAFIRELSLYFIFCFCCFNLSAALIYVYLSLVIYYQLKTPLATEGQMDIPNYVMTGFVVFTLATILVNQKVRWQHRNFILRGSPENPVVLYLMCLPMLAVTVVSLFFTLIFVASCYFIPESVQILAIVLTYVAMIMVLVNQNGSTDTGESWILNFSNFTAIVFSLIVLFTVGLYQLTMLHFFYFLEVESNFINISSVRSCTRHLADDSIFFDFSRTFLKNVRTIRSSMVLLSLSFAPYLFLPLQRNMVALERHIRGHLVYEDDSRPRSRISKYDILVNGILAILLILPKLIYLQFQYITYEMSLHILSVVQLLLMMVGILFQLRDFPFWQQVPRRNHACVYNQIILWLGTLGEQTNTIAHIAAVLLGVYSAHEQRLSITRAVRNTVQFLEVFLQTLLVASIIRRKFTNIKKESTRIFNFLNPFFYLAVLNIVFLVCSYISLLYRGDFKHDHAWKYSFIYGITVFSYPLALMYRFFCIIVLLRSTFHN